MASVCEGGPCPLGIHGDNIPSSLKQRAGAPIQSSSPPATSVEPQRTAGRPPGSSAESPLGASSRSGTTAYPDGRLWQYRAYYRPNWGRFKAKTSPVPGNHDFRTPDARGYRGDFGARAAGLLLLIRRRCLAPDCALQRPRCVGRLTAGRWLGATSQTPAPLHPRVLASPPIHVGHPPCLGSTPRSVLARPLRCAGGCCFERARAQLRALRATGSRRTPGPAKESESSWSGRARSPPSTRAVGRSQEQPGPKRRDLRCPQAEASPEVVSAGSSSAPPAEGSIDRERPAAHARP